MTVAWRRISCECSEAQVVRGNSFEELLQVDARASCKEGQVTLEMRGSCEKCQAPLEHGGTAFICSFECTFCQACAAAMAQSCPNCGGELVRRPRRKA
jgi:hypothetical protein